MKKLTEDDLIYKGWEMLQMDPEKICIKEDDLAEPLFSGLILNAWYSAQVVHQKEKGSLSESDKENLLFDVYLHFMKLLKFFTEAKNGSYRTLDEVRENLKNVVKTD